MSSHTVLGLALWVLIFYPMWSPRCIKIRRAKRIAALPAARVSRNQTGPKWEQDAPYPECFDIDREQEDDL